MVVIHGSTMEEDWIDTEQAKTMNIKKNEFRYATKTSAFAYKMPLDVLHIMIKYVGFNEIKLNPHNCINLTCGKRLNTRNGRQTQFYFSQRSHIILNNER